MGLEMLKLLADLIIGLPELLDQPGLLHPSLAISFWGDARKVTQLLETIARPRATSSENGLLWNQVLRSDTSEVGVNRSIHRAVECFPGLHPSVEQPAPAGTLLDFSVW